MSTKPDGKSDATQRVTFTRNAAERIAKVVRRVELGPRGAAPLRYDHIHAAKGLKLTLGTFTGAWQTAQTKVVTYTVGTATATASVYNHCNPALLDNKDTANTTKTRFVIFGKVSGINSVVEIQMRSTSTECATTMVLGTVDLTDVPGYEAGVIQLLGHSAGDSTGDTASTACPTGLQWYSITNCAPATAS